jgi:dienelactone hydrolase
VALLSEILGPGKGDVPKAAGGKKVKWRTDFDAALKEAGSDHEVHVYDEADHGFNCDQRATYHEESAKDAWNRTKQLFAKELRG